MIKDNAIYLLFIFIIFCSWILAFYIRKSDKGDGKRKKIAGWMIFGGLWPLIDKNANRDLTKRDKIWFFIVIVFMASAFTYTYFSTNGSFIWLAAKWGRT